MSPSFWIQRLIFWIFITYSLLYSCQAALKIYYVEELCNSENTEAELPLKYHPTGILTSISSASSPTIQCDVNLKPEIGSSIVLSIYRYNIEPEERLVIKDGRDFQAALLGKGEFYEERPSFKSDGFMTISYFGIHNVSHSRNRLKFYFVFTQVHEGHCSDNEFQCRNRNCVPKNLLCDGHSHCGDNSDKEKCDHQFTKLPIGNAPKTVVNPAWIIGMVISGTMSFIIFIVLVVFLARALKKRKLSANEPSSNSVRPTTASSPTPPTTTNPAFNPTLSGGTPSATGLSTDASMHSPSTIYRRTAAENVEAYQDPSMNRQISAVHAEEGTYQVPPMYPQMSAVHSEDGAYEVPSINPAAHSEHETYQVPSMYPEISAVHAEGGAKHVSSMYPRISAVHSEDGNYQVNPQIPEHPTKGFPGHDNPNFKPDE